MRSYKKIMPVLLTFALVGSAVYSFQSRAEKRQQYNSALTQARIFADKDIEKDAMEHYQTALGLEPSLSVYLEAGEVYLDQEDKRGAIKWYEKELLPNYPKEAETYLYGMRIRANWEDYQQLFVVYRDYQKRELHSDEVEQLAKSCWYTYSTTGTFEEVGVFAQSSGMAAAKYNGRWGYVDSTGRRVVSYNFDEAGLMGDYAPVTGQDGRVFFIDAGGNEEINEQFLLEKDPNLGTVTGLKNLYSNLILASNGQQWSYYDLNTYEKKFGGYAQALPVANGAGAVSQDGEKWALISADGTLLTDYIYDEVLADEKEIICRGDVLLVKRDGTYILINSSGEQIGSGSYTNAKPFYETSYAAVEKDGKWIFVDGTGAELDLGDFEDAQSFSNGLAAVKQDGKWGYIDTQGNLVVPNEFFEAGPFNDKGACFVKTRQDLWQLLRFYRFQA